jgi:hypothetical protein
LISLNSEIEMRVSIFCLALTFIAPMLAGCAGSIVGDAIAGPEKLAQQDDAYCTSIGLQLGQPDYARCRMMREAARERHHAQSRAMLTTGLAMMAEQPSAPAPATPPNVVTPQMVQSPALSCHGAGRDLNGNLVMNCY